MKRLKRPGAAKISNDISGVVLVEVEIRIGNITYVR